MRGHDDLALLRHLHTAHQLQEFNLTSRRARGFRLVENEDALLLTTLFKERQKAFAMRMREEVRRSLASFARRIIKIAGNREEALGPKEPAVGDLWQPACAQCL